MAHQRLSVGYALGVLALVGGFCNLQAAPSPDHVFATWSLGPAIAAVAILWRDRGAWSLLAGLAAGTSYALADRPLSVALVGGLGTALLTWWGAGLVRGDAGLVLRDEKDLQRLLRAAAVLALAAGALAWVMAAAWGRALDGLMPLAFAMTTAVSVLVLVALVAGLPGHAAPAGRRERAGQWVALVVLSAVAVLPAGPQQLALLILLPVLGWGASRQTPRGAMAQLYGTLLVLAVGTYLDVGALSELADLRGLDEEGMGLVLIGFALIAALVSITVVLRTHDQLQQAFEAGRQRDLLQQVFDATNGVAIIGSDDDGLVTNFNVGAERLLGWTAGEVLGRPRALLHPDPTDDPVLGSRFFEGRAVTGIRVDFLRRDREVRTHQLSVSRLHDASGVPCGHLTTSEDITEVVETNQLLTEALERQRLLDEAKDVFVSSVSHELRTPLTSIVGNLEMVQDGTFGDVHAPLSSAVDRVARNSRRLLALVDDLLLLSQVERQVEGQVGRRGRSEDELVEVVGVARAVCEVVREAEPAADVVLEATTEPVWAHGRARELERAVEHLVLNAVKFSPDRPGARVRVDVRDGEVTIEVADDGIGIPDDEHGAVFERFVRGRGASEMVSQGAGLGLAIVSGVAARHRGRVSMSSAEGQGSTFALTLPCAAPAAELFAGPAGPGERTLSPAAVSGER